MIEKIKEVAAIVWNAIAFIWSWVAWLWDKYEGLVHDYPRGAAISFILYVIATVLV